MSRCALPSRDWRRTSCSIAKSANKLRRSPCKVPTRTRVTFHSQTCYRFRPVGGAIREISAKVIGSRYFCLSILLDRPVTFDSSRRSDQRLQHHGRVLGIAAASSQSLRACISSPASWPSSMTNYIHQGGPLQWGWITSFSWHGNLLSTGSGFIEPRFGRSSERPRPTPRWPAPGYPPCNAPWRASEAAWPERRSERFLL